MDKPERVGLLFPRSGQQVFVNVPAHWAQALRSGEIMEAVVRVETGPPRSYSGPNEEYGREP